MAVRFKVNGQEVTTETAGEAPLLWVLRDELRLTGTKFGCGIAQCGACTVHVDGKPRRSCVTPVGSVEGHEITTIEGLEGPTADAVKEAWAAIDVPQCGYCQSGQVMTAVALLNATPDPRDNEIDGAMTGNICRCATYVRIRQAIKDAASSVKEG